MTDYPTSRTKPTVTQYSVPSSRQRKDSGCHDVDGLDLKILSVNAIPSSTRIACTLVRYVQNSRDEPLHISVLECRELEIPETIKTAVATESRQKRTGATHRRPLDTVLGHMFSASVLIFCRKCYINPASIDLISFSGQWLALAPVSEESEALTANMITAQTGITSVTGFRIGGDDSHHHAGAVIPRFLEEELDLVGRDRAAVIYSISLSYQGLETLLGRLIRTPKAYRAVQSISSRIIICGRITPGSRWDELREKVVRFTRGERLLPVVRIATQERDLSISHRERCSNQEVWSGGHCRDNSWRSIVGING
ncbi:hypothetical protein K491DRAFT_415232 [Lophiostoma macrostomum CBS 122681]|uniref:Uncharacterized protein n=1 Tax=Lophiostoma macrostomum CBS 122681 TaxID=1314788 RepID=A0A6A6TN40_9PLEO|nr:hypothetical protein K491DRAFT_415232 [Lophiostoma macrostomum CBS 122681]